MTKKHIYIISYDCHISIASPRNPSKIADIPFDTSMTVFYDNLKIFVGFFFKFTMPHVKFKFLNKFYERDNGVMKIFLNRRSYII
ncbi:hypothetical protein BpHYR1_014605 [Brachionus plicatilis]|uniref:Uncharacterized protein n=1 Tax=Brachionus plicatilis TaxID=10195 RepID=A0A3M7PV07_BRAPC|nr:hypothetical protein BpHYR1_014605 [Brachionus plicatilis]